jgi:hypothetical protein
MAAAGICNSAKVAFRWSFDEIEAPRLQEEDNHHYLRWTFFGAVAVMVVGLIGVGMSFCIEAGAGQSWNITCIRCPSRKSYPQR